MSFYIQEILEKAKNLHFVGIGGVSISSLALLANEMGYKVSGSDRARNALSEKCESAGINVIYGHFPENVENADAVIYTAAVNMSNPELKRASEKSIPCIPRSDFLGYIMLGYKKRIGISGTHGKTTTTSMLSHILIKSGMDPTVANGAVTEELNGTLGIGSRDYFIYESCEYKDSFLSFFPTTAIITNIELDHTDYYSSLGAIITSFRKSLIPAKTVIINEDDPNVLLAVKDCTEEGKEILGISLQKENAYCYAKNLHYEDGRGIFTLTSRSKELCEIKLSVIGAFNVYNALSAAAAALSLGVQPESIALALSDFRPAKRRFEIKSEKNGIMIADDYAHHPSEIAATLRGVRNIGKKRIICIFQPHTYSRTRDLFDDFAVSLSLADITVLADIYAARETETIGVSSELLAQSIRGAVYLKSFEEIAKYVSEIMREGDIVLTMGAGDVYKIGNMIIDIAEKNLYNNV